MMSFNEHLGEPEEFRVVLVLRWSRMVLVEHHDHKLSIAAHQRAKMDSRCRGGSPKSSRRDGRFEQS